MSTIGSLSQRRNDPFSGVQCRRISDVDTTRILRDSEFDSGIILARFAVFIFRTRAFDCVGIYFAIFVLTDWIGMSE